MRKKIDLEEIKLSDKSLWKEFNGNMGSVGIGIIVVACISWALVHWILAIIIVFGGLYLLGHFDGKMKNKAIASLLNKYKDQDIVDKIMNDEYWQGMTEGMLFDSLGGPGKHKEDVLKERIKTLYYFNPSDDSQENTKYKFEVTVENDLVVGWREGEKF